MMPSRNCGTPPTPPTPQPPTQQRRRSRRAPAESAYTQAQATTQAATQTANEKQQAYDNAVAAQDVALTKVIAAQAALNGEDMTLGRARITVGDCQYTGGAVTPRYEVVLNGRLLRKNVDYIVVDPMDLVSVGKKTALFQGIGIYSGWGSATFYVVRAFPDVPADAWYAGVVGRASALGLINGYNDGRFGPNDRITRGQVAVILWNMAGSPGVGAGARDFPDVRSADYFYGAVRWASSRGVVSGYANGRFGPDDNVTREQLAVMLANYSTRVAGKSASGSDADYVSMADHGKVSSWAVPAVGWCFRNKILSGSGGKVLPQGSATRAEAAKMVVVLHDLLACTAAARPGRHRTGAAAARASARADKRPRRRADARCVPRARGPAVV